MADELEALIESDHDNQVYRIKCCIYFDREGVFWYEDTWEDPLDLIECTVVVWFYSPFPKSSER